ncbi:MAG: hypothetical protein ABJZ55_08460 [Fuerstiella sp.]
MLLAHFELERVAQGDLLLFALPWEAKPATVEIVDAKLSVRENHTSAIIVLLIMGIAVMLTGPMAKKSLHEQRPLIHSVMAKIFVLAAVADMLSTIWFFHVQGIDFEFHPAIRLFGYAYGRTFGPVAGKLIQAGGIIYVAVLLNGRASFLLYSASAVYLVASIYNIAQTLTALNP